IGIYLSLKWSKDHFTFVLVVFAKGMEAVILFLCAVFAQIKKDKSEQPDLLLIEQSFAQLAEGFAQ
ncbi:MAG TPA: hypothetical protein PK323_02965, partial [Bacteroidia bacterium]|nr:hypothetical protein [Bacteroidia bacterium]